MTCRFAVLLLAGVLVLATGFAVGVSADVAVPDTLDSATDDGVTETPVDVSSVEENDSTTISINESIETPEETVSVEGDEFAVTAVARVFPGENLTVDVTGTDAENYQINLYTASEEVVDFHTVTGDATVTFETDHLDPVPGPGSYVVAAVDNQEFLAVHPVVLADYHVDIEIPHAVETETDFDATVTLDAVTGDTAVSDVELVVWNEEARDRIQSTATGENTYEATVEGLASGDYELHAIVVDEETADGQENAVGFADPVTVTVSDNVDGIERGPDDENGENDDNGNGDTGDENGGENGDTSDENGDTADGAGDENGDIADDGVLTPSETDDADDADDDGDGFGVAVALVAFFAFLAALTVRSR